MRAITNNVGDARTANQWGWDTVGISRANILANSIVIERCLSWKSSRGAWHCCGRLRYVSIDGLPVPLAVFSVSLETTDGASKLLRSHYLMTELVLDFLGGFATIGFSQN